MNYWLFQANPTKYRIEAALSETIDPDNWTWDVKQNKQYIKKGDKVIIWRTGKDAGILALATVTSDVQFLKDLPGKKFAIDKQFNEVIERVRLRVDVNLVKTNKVIPKSVILNNVATQALKQGYRGTNFVATTEEYHTIMSMIFDSKDAHFGSVKWDIDPLEYQKNIRKEWDK